MYYFILFYIRRAILTQTNPKKVLEEKKTHHIEVSKELRKNLYSKIYLDGVNLSKLKFNLYPESYSIII